MVFKSFRFHVILRIFMLILMMWILTWCLVNELYLRSVYIGVAIVIATAELLWYIERFNRDIKVFLDSVMHHDFTTQFPLQGKGEAFDQLYDTLNQIIRVFKQVSSEKEIQHRYLEMLVDHVRVGILSYDENEKVHLINNSLKKLLQKNVFTDLKALLAIDQDLLQTVRNIHAGETRLVKVRVANGLLQLSVHASEFRLEGQYFKLISMQNIRNELDAREMEAWQKLIRVLTHEIMNSVSPISSLSATLHELIRQNGKELRPINNALYEALIKGLEAIRIRSEGLHHFTEAYRKLTRIPTASFKKVNVKDLIQRVQVLFQAELSQKNIRLEVMTQAYEVSLDPDLIEQVLINLIRNAIESFGDDKNRTISVRSLRDSQDRVSIEVSDNGAGMDKDTLEKIFIPFYSTKKHGSGIGLALTKQILHLHNAEVKVESVPGKGSVFTLVF